MIKIQGPDYLSERHGRYFGGWGDINWGKLCEHVWTLVLDNEFTVAHYFITLYYIYEIYVINILLYQIN